MLFIIGQNWTPSKKKEKKKNPEERKPVNCVQTGALTFSACVPKTARKKKKESVSGISICCETVKLRGRARLKGSYSRRESQKTKTKTTKVLWKPSDAARPSISTLTFTNNNLVVSLPRDAQVARTHADVCLLLIGQIDAVTSRTTAVPNIFCAVNLRQ